LSTRIESEMDIATARFPNGLPTLEELKRLNGPDVPAETAWIWGSDDEVSGVAQILRGYEQLYREFELIKSARHTARPC
jgi:hypothetical protein